MKQQIPFAFPLRSRATFSNFVVENNAELVQSLTALKNPGLNPAIPPGAARTVWIWGEAGLGRTHLLNACCHWFNTKQAKVAYIPTADWQSQGDSFAGYQGFDLVAIDDVHLCLNKEQAERDLVELYQAMQNTSGYLLLSADRPPGKCTYAFKDLASRFTSAETYQLSALSDPGKMQVMQSQAAHRGIELEEEVARFMLTRCSRHLSDLIKLLDELDQQSWARKRKLTIPFLKEVLKI